MGGELVAYGYLLTDIKNCIQQAQMKAALSANAELIRVYWEIGRMIAERQALATAVIPRLSHDLRNELPEIKGFSERNLGRMVAFFRAYPNLPQPVANTPLLLATPWGHHALLLEKVKEPPLRLWYMEQTLQHGWSREALATMIQTQLHVRQGAAITNFEHSLPNPQSDLARQALKDPYIFDFLTLTEPFQERELEVELIKQLEKFLLELGTGFAFVGRQYHLEVSNQDFYLDLLFYHLKLRCYVVIDLKKGDFKPEYAGKMNFYCSAVDDKLKHATDQATIGLILCQTKDRIIAEYTLRNMQKPIGISAYELTRVLPEELKSSLPTIAEIEQELVINLPLIDGGGMIFPPTATSEP